MWVIASWSVLVLFVCVFVSTRLHSVFLSVFFLMIRRPPRSTLDRSSAASDVYKRQLQHHAVMRTDVLRPPGGDARGILEEGGSLTKHRHAPVSYTHLRAHETVLDLVCRPLLEKKNTTPNAHESSTLHQPPTRHCTYNKSIVNIRTTNTRI